jgi:putative transposase
MRALGRREVEALLDLDRLVGALAESFNGPYKAELVRHSGPWRGLDDVEYA